MINIIQLIPNNDKDIQAVYKNDDGTEFKTKIVAIGLCDEGDMHFMDSDPFGEINIANEPQNFVRIEGVNIE